MYSLEISVIQSLFNSVGVRLQTGFTRNFDLPQSPDFLNPSVADPDLQIRGSFLGGRSCNPEIRRGDSLKRNFSHPFGPQFGPKNKEGPGPRAPQPLPWILHRPWFFVISAEKSKPNLISSHQSVNTVILTPISQTFRTLETVCLSQGCFCFDSTVILNRELTTAKRTSLKKCACAFQTSLLLSP